ncbi:hypothetical protein AAC387_Pa07g2408 [Persea americana]
MSERKRSKATESQLAMARRALACVQDTFIIALRTVYAIASEQIYKNDGESQKADPSREESIVKEPNSSSRNWKRVPRVQPNKNPTRLGADPFTLCRQDV